LAIRPAGWTPGKPVLAFPFSAAELLRFVEESMLPALLHWCEQDENDTAAFSCLESNPRARALAMFLAGGPDPTPEAHPAEASAPAEVVAAAVKAQASTEPAQAEPPTDRPVPKRVAVAELQPVWPSVLADINDASRNGLRAFAGAATGRGWHVERMRQWAAANWKLREPASVMSPHGWFHRQR
jgi:hypothetical protein